MVGIAMPRKRLFPRRKPARAARQHQKRRSLNACNLGFETLEDRRMLSTINWSNRGVIIGGDDDRFDDVFGPMQNQARAVVGAALAEWARVIDKFNYSDGTNTFNVKIAMASVPAGSGDGRGVGAANFAGDRIGGKPSSSTITLDWRTDTTPGANSAAGWFLDPTPLDSSEFQALGDGFYNAFARLPTENHGSDLFTVVLHEMGHAIGFDSTSRTRNPAVAINTNFEDTVNSPASDPVSTLWLASNHSLWTEYNGGPENRGGPVHFAPLGSQAVVGGITYSGAVALMNAVGGFERELISDLEADFAGIAYGYTITRPSSFGTMYDTLDADGTLRINTMNLIDSDDFVQISTSGGTLNVFLTLGAPVAGIDPAGISSSFNLSDVKRISINLGDGNDTFHIEPIGSAIPIALTGGDHGTEDRLDIVGSTGYDNFTLNSRTITSTGINIDDFGNVETIAFYTNGGEADVTIPHFNFDMRDAIIYGSLDDDTINLYSLDLFAPLTIYGSSGNDTISIASGGSVVRSPVTVFGDEGDDTVYLVPDAPFATGVVTAAVTVNGGAGMDTLHVGSGNVDAVSADITFNGDGGFLNYVYYHDRSLATAVSYDIGPGVVTRDGFLLPHTLTYTNTLQIEIDGNDGTTTFNIHQTPGTKVVAYGNRGNDKFTIGGGNFGLANADYTVYGQEDSDTLVLDDSLYSGATEWVVDSQAVFRGTLGIQEFDYSGFEAVSILAGLGGAVGNTINVVGDLHVDLSITGGSGIETLNLTNFKNRYDVNPEVLTYAANFDLGGGVNFLNVDETAGLFTTFNLYPTQLSYLSFFAAADTIIDFANISGGIAIKAGDDSNIVNIYGVPTTLSDYQNTILTNGGEDQFFVYPHDSAGHSTINGNLGLGGGGGTDTVTVDDSGTPISTLYTFSNDFGAGTTNISTFFGTGFGVGGDVENLNMIGSARSNIYSISTYQSPTTALFIKAGGGDDALAISSLDKNLETTISRTVPYSFDGGDGADSISLYNDNGTSTATWVYYSEGDVVSAFNIGTTYYLPINNINAEFVNVTGGAQAELFVIDGVSSGKTVHVDGGAGLDNFYVASISGNPKLIQGQVILDGGLDGASLNVYDTANSVGSTIHIEDGFDATLGSLPGDTLFGAGGSLQYRNLADQSGVGLALFLGSGADTIYARPQTTATMSIDAGDPTSGAGDKLNLILTQTQNPVVQITGVGAGNLTSSNRKTVKWTGIETLDSNAVAPTGLLVVNTLDSGPGSLRQAMLDANATPNAGGPDVIRFAIPGTGAHTIQPLSPLPSITDPVVLDATTQSGYAGKPVIELDGSLAGRTNGLFILSGGTTVRGLAINRFAELSDIDILGAGGNVIQGNYIGTNLAGNAVFQLASPTVWGIVVSGSDNNIIGTDGDGVNDALEGNVISGHGGAGILLESGQPGEAPDNNVIAGNRIGTSADGNTALGNGRMGVFFMNGGTGNRIGTNSDGVSDVAERNLISGNNEAGIFLDGNGNVIAGNYIGTNAAGNAALPNGYGVDADGHNNNRIGGTAAGAGNLVAFNVYDGVLVDHGGTGNSILGNSIFSNGRLGINLNVSGQLSNGVSLNDTGDADTGPNNLQNFPQITTAFSSGTQTTVAGTIQSTPGKTFRVDFFSSPTANTSGFGEGKTYLGFISVTTDSAGNANFVTTFSTVVAVGQVISATATDPSNNTSEFSASVQVVAGSSLPNVVALRSPTIQTNFLVSSPAGSSLTASVAATPGVGLPLGVQFPFGFVNFAVQGITPGSTADVTISGLDTSLIADYYKYGATPASSSDHWYNFLFGQQTDVDSPLGTGMEVVGGNLVLHLVDGGRGDDDLAANGIIVDIGGPAVANRSQTILTSDHVAGSTYGQLVHFTAIVSAAGGTPTGSVQFKIDGANFGSPKSLSGGQASLDTSALSAIDHAVTALYSSNSNAFADSGDDFVQHVNRAPLTIKADDKSKTAGEANPPLTFTAIGFVNGDTPASLTTQPILTTTATTSSPAGPYPITASGAANSNYTIGYTAGTLTVKPRGNQSPAARNDSAATTKNTAVEINVLSNDSDPDGSINVKTVSIVAKPSHGKVSVDSKTGVVTYTPDKNFTGSDSFTYKVKDNSGAYSNVATVSLTITAPNQPPQARDDSATTGKNVPVTINVLANDKDTDGTIDPTTVAIVGAAKHGTTSINPTTGVVTYTPATNYTGTDTFTYKVKDNQGAYSNVASVNVTVTAPNQPPQAYNDSATVKKNKSVVINVLANDRDSDGSINKSSLLIVAGPRHGTLKIDSKTGVVTYTPAKNYTGSDSFTYQVQDNLGAFSNVATVNLTVNS